MPTWLVLEDEEGLRLVLGDLFAFRNIQTVFLKDAYEALNWIESVNKAGKADPMPELALLDVRMPPGSEYSGVDVGRWIRSSKVVGSIPIAMMSAYAVQQDEIEEMKLITGANLFLPKPLPRIDELFRLLYALADGNKPAKTRTPRYSQKR